MSHTLEDIMSEHMKGRAKIKDALMRLEWKTLPSLAIAADLIPDHTDIYGDKKRWEVVEDVVPTKFEVTDLELVFFLKEGESAMDGIPGYVMRERAVVLGANLGLADAKYILKHKKKIPIKFRYHRIVFTGTLLKDFHGDLKIPFLMYYESYWFLKFMSVDRRWGWMYGYLDDVLPHLKNF